jgi:hypothetical protein
VIAVVAASSSASIAAVAQHSQFANAARGEGHARKAVAVVKADEPKAFQMFYNGQGGFRGPTVFRSG